jgi:hypothetical protein
MEDILEEPEIILEKDMFLTIWTKPTQTFRYIFKYCPTKYVNGIITTYGITNVLIINLLFLLNHTRFSIILTFIIGLLGWLFTWVWVYIWSSAMSWSGGWIGGRAAMDQFVTVSAWSFIPLIGSIFPLAIQAIIFENTDSINVIETQSVLIKYFYYLLLTVRFILTIWYLIIFVKGTAVLQKFDYKKTALNVILALSIILVPVIVIGGLIYLL